MLQAWARLSRRIPTRLSVDILEVGLVQSPAMPDVLSSPKVTREIQQPQVHASLHFVQGLDHVAHLRVQLDNLRGAEDLTNFGHDGDASKA